MNMVKCPICKGRGKKTLDVWGTSKEIDCMLCQTTGKMAASEVCPTCRQYIGMCECKKGKRD